MRTNWPWPSRSSARTTAPFITAVNNAKVTLSQAFNVRQQLDDAVPETPAQRRDLLTRVIVAAAKADQELEAQQEAFEKLRDLVINAPTRLDALTQQVVDITARIEPSEQTLAELHSEFADAALVSVAGNVTPRRTGSRSATTTSPGRGSWPPARSPVSQAELVDTIRAAESALGQAQSLLDAVDSAASDISRAAATLPSAIADIQAGIEAAATSCGRTTCRMPEIWPPPAAPRLRPSATPRATGTADPLGAFTN